MNDQWHLLQDGQQYGPYTGDQLVEFANDGRIVRESMLWAEGMADWVKAADVEGLFPPEATPVASYIPGGPPPPWMRGGAAAATAHPVAAAPVGRPGVAMVRPGLLLQAVLGENYPPTDAKPGWFGLVVSLMGGGVGFYLLLGVLLGGNILKQDRLTGGSSILLLILVFLAALAIVTAKVLTLVYMARLWSVLRYSTPRTSAGKAVGLLFVPFFNLYWIFMAFHGLAQDWNRITSQHPDLAHAPKLREGVFLAFCIGSVCFPPLAFVLWFPVMAQICAALNFMAFRPTHHPGTFNIR